jgi:hypothetical protein
MSWCPIRETQAKKRLASLPGKQISPFFLTFFLSSNPNGKMCLPYNGNDFTSLLFICSLKTALFWVITHRVVIITYLYFGTTYRSRLVTDTDGAVYCAYGDETEFSMSRSKLGHPAPSFSRVEIQLNRLPEKWVHTAGHNREDTGVLEF